MSISRYLRLVITTLVAVMLSFVAVGTAAAAPGPIISRAGAYLSGKGQVYVDPNATGGLSTDQVNKLTDAIKAGPHPVFLAVLPDTVRNEVNGDANKLPSAVGDQTRLSGVYAVWAGSNVFRAQATQLAGVPQAPSLASAAYQKYVQGNGPFTGQVQYNVLMEFVTKIQQIPLAVNSVGQKQPFPWGTVLLWVFGVIALVGVTALVLVRKRNKRLFAAAKTVLHGSINSTQDSYNTVSLIGATDAQQDAWRQGDGKLATARTLVDQAKNIRELDRAEELVREARRLFGTANGEIPSVAPTRSVPSTSLTQAASRPAGTTNVTNITNVYNANNLPPTYGYYPKYGKTGHIDPITGGFIAGMIGGVAGVLITEAVLEEAGEGWGRHYADPIDPRPTRRRPVVVDCDDDDGDDRSGYTDTMNGTEVGGGGGWSSGNNSGSSFDSGGWGSDSSDSGGGGDW